MLSVLLTDLAHWRYLLTADRLLLLLLLTIAGRLLLQIIFTFGKVHRSNCPTADWHQQETASKVNTFWRSAFPNPSQKWTLLQNIIWIMWSTFSLSNDWKISVLSCHHHALEGEILWCIIDYVGMFGNASYGCLLLRFSSDFHRLLLTLRWPSFVFCIFFRYEWVFAGICFWYFPLPAGALDLRPWPFCRPGRKLTGPGTDPGTMQTTSNSALIYCFCPNYLFILLYFFIY